MSKAQLMERIWDLQVRLMLATGRMPDGSKLTPTAVSTLGLNHLKAMIGG